MSRQKYNGFEDTLSNKLYLEKQTLKIKNVGLKHQLSLLKEDVQSVIIKCKELCRVKQNLYCLLEKTKTDLMDPQVAELQADKQNTLRNEITKTKQQVKSKSENIKSLEEEYKNYTSKHEEMANKLSEITQTILKSEHELQKETKEIKQIKQINFDLEKMRRTLQDQKDTTIQFQENEKCNHESFEKQYQVIMERLINDQVNVKKILILSKRKYALLMLSSLFISKMDSYYARFWTVRLHILSGERSLKCIQNILKIWAKNNKYNTRVLFSTWLSNIFDCKKVAQITQTVVSAKTQYKIKCKTFSMLDESYNIQQLSLLKEYDKAKLLYQLKMKYLRKDSHIALTSWWNIILGFKSKKNILTKIAKTMDKKVKERSFITWRTCLVSKRQSQQVKKHEIQLNNLRNISYALNKLEQTKFIEEEQKLRLYFDRYDLIERAKNQLSYHKRMNKIIQVLQAQHEKNQLRSALYIYHSKCISLRAKQTKLEFKIIKQQKQEKCKEFKSTQKVKSQYRKKLIVSFLDRFLCGRQQFYDRKVCYTLSRWHRNTAKINAIIKCALRKNKLGALNCLINHSLHKKYRISPEQIQSLKTKKKQFEEKQNSEKQNIRSLQYQNKLVSLTGLSQIINTKQYFYKSQLFAIHYRLVKNHLRAKALSKSLDLMRFAYLRKGVQAIKIRSTQVKENTIFNKKLEYYNQKRMQRIIKVSMEGWKKLTFDFRKILNFLNFTNTKFSQKNMKLAFSTIKQFYYQKTSRIFQKSIYQLNSQILVHKQKIQQIKKQNIDVQCKTKSSLRQFFEYFNKKLSNQYQKECKKHLKSKFLKWKKVLTFQKKKQASLILLLQKTKFLILKKAFFNIFQSSVYQFCEEYKEKIANIYKKDKINQSKIEKGDRAFGQILQKQKENNAKILQELTQKQTRFNKLLYGHHNFYRRIHQKSLMTDCLRSWKRLIETKSRLLMIASIWNQSKIRISFSFIKRFSALNESKNNKVRAIQKVIKLSQTLISKQSYELWKEASRNYQQTDLIVKSDTLSIEIQSKQQLREQIKQSHSDFLFKIRGYDIVQKIFKSWKNITTSQKLIDTKQVYLTNLRKSLLFRKLIASLAETKTISFKIKNLKHMFNKSKKLRQKTSICKINSCVKTIKQFVKHIDSKITHCYTANLYQAFSKIQRASSYKTLAFQYQRRKSAFRMMSSIITQAQLNRIKTFFSFLKYQQKVHHYLPNILVSIQKKILHKSLYKIKQVSYENQKIVKQQAECIMERQKYEINMEMKQMMVEKINGQQLKEYIQSRTQKDENLMRKAICRLNLMGGKKKLIKTWNSWIEFIKIKKIAREKLQNVIDINSGQMKYWNRWKNTNAFYSEQISSKSTRKELTSRYQQLRKLSIIYRKQLFQMRGQISELRSLNNTQEHKLTVTTKMALKAIFNCFNKGLSSVISLWKGKAKKRVSKSKKYDMLTMQIQQLITKRGALQHRLSEVNSGNSSLRQNCIQGGVQAEMLKYLLLQKQNLSSSLADKKHNIKILLQDNLKIKDKLKQAQTQAIRLVNQFQPLMDRTNF